MQLIYKKNQIQSKHTNSIYLNFIVDVQEKNKVVGDVNIF